MCVCVCVFIQDGVGSENQGSFRAVHRDGEEEAGESVSRYLSHWNKHPQIDHDQKCPLTPPCLCASVRSQRATGIGRLMVNIVEGIELKPCRSHGTCELLNLEKEKRWFQLLVIHKFCSSRKKQPVLRGDHGLPVPYHKNITGKTLQVYRQAFIIIPYFRFIDFFIIKCINS